MTRDDDFIRDLLLEAEASDQPSIIVSLPLAPDQEELKRHMHTQWLCDAGLFAPVGQHTFRITNQGHDYLTAIRDEGIWKRTKETAASAGGATLGIMKEIAVAILKEKVKETARGFGWPM